MMGIILTTLRSFTLKLLKAQHQKHPLRLPPLKFVQDLQLHSMIFPLNNQQTGYGTLVMVHRLRIKTPLILTQVLVLLL